MLKENTGIHFLDSGGTDGRGWQRNAKRTIKDFMNEPIVSYIYDRKYKNIERTVSVFHFLGSLELDEFCDMFNKANTKTKDWDSNGEIYGVSIKAEKVLQGIANEHKMTEPRIWNTYNGDSDLSQTLQGASFTIDGEEYVIVQIHNGADVRGGYTDAKMFKVTDEYYSVPEYMPLSDILEYELEYIDVKDEEGLSVSMDELLKLA